MKEKPIVGEWREGLNGLYRRRRSRNGKWYTEAAYTNWGDNGPVTERVTTGISKPSSTNSGCVWPLLLLGAAFFFGSINPMFFFLVPIAVLVYFSNV